MSLLGVVLDGARLVITSLLITTWLYAGYISVGLLLFGGVKRSEFGWRVLWLSSTTIFLILCPTMLTLAYEFFFVLSQNSWLVNGVILGPLCILIFIGSKEWLHDMKAICLGVKHG